MAKENIHGNHRQRLRKQFADSGLDYMSDYQVLELLLFYAIPRKDTNPISHALINEFGSLSGVLNADAKMLEKVEGVGEISAQLITLIPALIRRYLTDDMGKRPMLRSIEEAARYLSNMFIGQHVEVLYMLCLDARFVLKRTVKLHEGTLDEVAVYPRRVVEEVLKSDAKNVILSHNHPSGRAKPSTADLKVTENIMAALKPLGVNLIDHIVVSNSEYYSFVKNDVYKRGIMDSITKYAACDE